MPAGRVGLAEFVRLAKDRSEPGDPRGRGTIGRTALILLAGLCTYWNSLDIPFLWDDEVAIVSNQTIRELRPLSRPLLPPLETPVAGRPLVNVSFALNYAVGGLDVRGYHAVNLGVHLMAALLLFGIVRRTLERERPGGRAGADASKSPLSWRCGGRSTR